MKGTTPPGARNEREAALWVRDMFARVAHRYDLANHLLSFNIHRVWRPHTARRVSRILERPEARVLDICCGTGDLLLALAVARASQGSGAGASACQRQGLTCASDFCHPMLTAARAKLERRRVRAPLFEADALRLPLGDASFDLITAAFGFRNLANYGAGLEEMRRVRVMVRRARQQLVAEGKPYGRVQMGLMLEVPAAAISIDQLLEVVDFVSIGSNDLVQYLMAADRDNPKVSHLCQPLSPPVLRVLNKVIRTCRRAGKPVTLCGEMAGAPRAFVLLFGMGLRSFSMSPAFLPSIKELTHHLTRKQTREILRQALALKTTDSVQRFMAKQIAQIAPNLKLLDSA